MCDKLCQTCPWNSSGEDRKGANEYSIRITNDGDAPEKNAEEGGGLSALRKAAESEKCIMQVSFSPEFCLVLKNATDRKDGSLWYGY